MSEAPSSFSFIYFVFLVEKVGQYLHSDRRKSAELIVSLPLSEHLLNLSVLYCLTEGICQEVLMIKLNVHVWREKLRKLFSFVISSL